MHCLSERLMNNSLLFCRQNRRYKLFSKNNGDTFGRVAVLFYFCDGYIINMVFILKTKKR